MSVDLHAINIGNSKYVCHGSSLAIEAMNRYESEVVQFYVMEEDLADVCEGVFEEILYHTGKIKDWRQELEDLAEIILFVKANGDCTFEVW
jgi:hypothetical protein